MRQGGMGPRSALCAATAATDRQDDLTAGVGGEALGVNWGGCRRLVPLTGLGASRPSPHTSQKRAAGGARLDWRWQGRAGFGLGLFGSDGCSSLKGWTRPELLLPESHGLRARPVGRVPRLGKWAGGQVGTGQEAPAATGGSSSSGVQLETWARGGGRLGRQPGGLSEGCTSPPFFLPSFQNTTAETLSTDEKNLRPSKQKPSRTWHTWQTRPTKTLRMCNCSRCQCQGCDETDWLSLPRRQAHKARKGRNANNGRAVEMHSSSKVSIYRQLTADKLQPMRPVCGSCHLGDDFVSVAETFECRKQSMCHPSICHPAILPLFPSPAHPKISLPQRLFDLTYIGRRAWLPLLLGSARLCVL